MAVKKKGNARRKQREQRRVAKAKRHTPKAAKPGTVRRKIVREGPVPSHAPQADGDSTPLHDDFAMMPVEAENDPGNG